MPTEGYCGALAKVRTLPLGSSSTELKLQLHIYLCAAELLTLSVTQFSHL